MNVCIITYGFDDSPIRRIGKNLAADDNMNIHIVAPGPIALSDNSEIHPISPVIEEGMTIHRTSPALKYYAGNHDELKAIADYIIALHDQESFDLLQGVFSNSSWPVGLTRCGANRHTIYRLHSGERHGGTAIQSYVF